jgi:hypothetical protein
VKLSELGDEVSANGRAKHIEIKYHHIRDEVKSGKVKVKYCNTTEMLANVLTKGLPGHQDTKLSPNYLVYVHAC